ncbi:hypothetical protein R3P38DRAFT_3190434 [Favolaschia claudopus]|uniref:Uncharacterized protein n=1 Tax=Favolaschia claudopus TaxID=2862362 RepID=A0AAW0BM99_9AGAR
MTDEEDIPWTRQLLLLQSNASSKRKKVALCSMSAQRLCFTALVSRQHFREVSEFLDVKEKHRTSPADEEDNDSSVSGSSDSEAGSRAESLVSILLEAKADSLRVLSYTGDIDDDLPEGPGLRARIRVRRAVSARLPQSGHARRSGTTSVSFSLLRGALSSGRRLSLSPDLTLQCSPSELDIVTGRGKAPAVADFFILARVLQSSEGPRRFGLRRSRRHWILVLCGVLALGDNLKINIIESITDEPLDAVVRFHFTCVVAAWHADGIWLAYPELLKEALVITTPAAYPIESGFARRFSVWSAFRKYVEAGFRVHLNEYPRPHICGEDVNCPATLRSSDDAGCRFFAFPEWRYTGESGLPDPTCWTMGGSGCSNTSRSS